MRRCSPHLSRNVGSCVAWDTTASRPGAYPLQVSVDLKKAHLSSICIACLNSSRTAIMHKPFERRARGASEPPRSRFKIKTCCRRGSSLLYLKGCSSWSSTSRGRLSIVWRQFKIAKERVIKEYHNHYASASSGGHDWNLLFKVREG
jgi:hypothetical protein